MNNDILIFKRKWCINTTVLSHADVVMLMSLTEDGTEVVLPSEEVQINEAGNDQVDTEKKEDSNCGTVQESESRPTVSGEVEGNCGRIVEAERSDANCTLEMENIGQKSEDHSLASQIEEEEIGHGMEEDDDDDMSEMSDIPSQCGDEQLYTVK